MRTTFLGGAGVAFTVVDGREAGRSTWRLPAPPSTPAILVLAALTVTAIGQGGASRDDGLLAGLFLLLAVVAGARARPIEAPAPSQLQASSRLRIPVPVAVLAAMALWAATDGVLAGHPGDAVSTVAVLCAIGATIELVRHAPLALRGQVVGGVVALGAAVAASGWLGVVLRIQPWAHVDGGLWRAATTVTYANASAALLTVVALLAISQATVSDAPVWRLGAYAALVGAGSTLSRAGLAGAGVGLVVLAVVLGPRRVARACARPVAGAALALAGLLPSVSAAAPARPLWALLAAAAGLVVAHPAVRATRPREGDPGGRPNRGLVAVDSGGQPNSVSGDAARPWRRPPLLVALGLLAVLTVGLAGWVGLGAPHLDLGALRANRITLSSPDRRHETDAALATIRHHLIAGVGPGAQEFIWATPDRALQVERYAHDEYLQLAVEDGLIGVALLALLALAIGVGARRAWRSTRFDPTPRALQGGALAALAAVSAHSGFDFLWHVPAVALVGAVCVGLLTATAHQPMINQPKENT